MGVPSVSVCFPAFNEDASIGEMVQEADRLLASSGLEYEILVCNDGSTDQTGEIIDELARSMPSLRVFHHPRNLGIRATFEHLYAEASKEFVFLNAADRQWDTRILLDLLPLVKEWDIIVASRKKKHYGIVRAVVSWVFNAIPPLLFGVKTYDAGAVKLIRREIIERFPLVSRSPFSEAERLIRAARAGYRITEFPVEILPRRTGRARGVTWAAVLQAVGDIWRVWWSLRREHESKERVASPSR